jgi:hypothetical protein
MIKASISQSKKQIASATLFCLLMIMMCSSMLIVPIKAGTYDTTQITDNDYDDLSPQTDGELIVWVGYDGDYEIFLYDGSDVTKITDNTYWEYDPQIDDGMVVWQGYDSYGSDYDIWFYAGGYPTIISTNPNYDEWPRIDDGMVVWQGSDGYDYEIFLRDISGGTTTQITNNGYSDYYPEIAGDIVVWRGYDGNDYEIFFYSISSGVTTQLTNNDYYDYDPQTDGEVVVWRGYDIVGADYEIFIYDIAGDSTTKITDNDYGDYDPRIADGVVVWRAYDASANREIFMYDVFNGTTMQITDNIYRDDHPQIDGSMVVWQSYVGGGDYEILSTKIDIISPSTSILLSDMQGDDDWWKSDVTVALDAVDTGSGVAATYYRLEHGAAWETYVTDFNVTAEGVTTLEYYSVDNADPSNNETVKSETIKVDKTRPTGSIMIDGGAAYTNESSVVLTLSADDLTSGVAEMRFSNDTVAWSNWESYSVSTSATLPTGDGPKTVYYQIKDNAGHESLTYLDTITLDTVSPTGSIMIDGGAAYTNESSVVLTLSADDLTSGVAEMRFSSDGSTWTAWEASDTTKSWSLSAGDGAKTVYVQFKDNAGEVSLQFLDSITLDSLPPSIALTDSLANGTEVRSSTCTLSWTGADAGTGIDHYEVRVDNGTWTDTGNINSYAFTGLGDGSHTFDIKAVDASGKAKIYSLNLVINTSLIGGPGYLEEILIIVAIVAIIAVVIIYKLLKRPKAPPTPKKLKITMEPEELVADGKSEATITIHLLDKKDKPINALGDVEVKLTTTGGKIENPTVRISRGHSMAKTVLTSSTESGRVSVSASARGLESGAITLDFKEKPRFCMGCGTRMSAKDKKCQKCGAAPEQFTGPTKICKNCERKRKVTYLPSTAEFCSECGASQPKGEGD